jgi:phosphoglycerate dehydrogenase-like enzyme
VAYPVLVDARLERRWHRVIAQRLAGSRVVPVHQDGRPGRGAAGAHVCLAMTWSPSWLQGLVRAVPSLRYLHFPFAGMEQVLAVDLPARVTLGSSAGVHAIPIAEHVVAFILTLARRLPLFWEQQRQLQWKKAPLQELGGRRLGIYGYGGIGRAVAQRCTALGMEVWGLRRSGTPDRHAARMLTPSQLPLLLAASDFLLVAAALTPRTSGRIDAAALRRMQRGSYLLNVSRGAIVDDRALAAALRSGHLAGAYLDVFAEEPLPRASPLWRAPNCYVTPHVSFSTPLGHARMVELFCDNVRRLRSGRPIVNRVDRRHGY